LLHFVFASERDDNPGKVGLSGGTRFGTGQSRLSTSRRTVRSRWARRACRSGGSFSVGFLLGWRVDPVRVSAWMCRCLGGHSRVQALDELVENLFDTRGVKLIDVEVKFDQCVGAP
jgi:hypothetical protein